MLSFAWNYRTPFADGLGAKRSESKLPELGVQALDEMNKLGMIFEEVSLVINQWKPITMGIEKVFVNKNFDSALKLAQARSAVICAGTNAQLALGEYSPRTIKKSVVGSGAANKQQIQGMMQMLLKLDSVPQSDEADALAIAVCHANHMNVKSLGIAQGISRGRWV